MTVMRTKTPSGEAIGILPEAEFERRSALAEDATDARTIAASQDRLHNNNDELLTQFDLDRLRAAATPLAFWRDKRGLTISALAALVRTEVAVLAAMEQNERAGAIDLYRKLATALGIDVDDLVATADAA
ncbi:helix-turn-helix domain-containing protein [uncultured Methylobacterium sp.]|uniref:helix-turn-helix domain-containing protein n=1 Tax=uncultured Methylobacterium sp. TaxID=157278 RepID=UPI0035CC71F7